MLGIEIFLKYHYFDTYQKSKKSYKKEPKKPFEYNLHIIEMLFLDM